MIGDWQQSIARPDLADWVTVAAYLAAAGLAARAAGYAAVGRHELERLFWRFSAILLILFGVNELLDLQTLLSLIARAHAKANGWYAERRTVQYAFVIGLAAASLFAGIALLMLTRRMHPAVRLALAGLVFIGLFVLMRAASIHHFEEVLRRGPALFNFGSIQEMAGIAIVAAAAALYSRMGASTPG